MSELMDAEFGTVADWTAEAAQALGPEHHIAAGCRGSGGPGTLDLLLDGLRVRPGDRLLDVGAGVGGPAAYAASIRGARPVLVEPQAAACRAARRLFALPTVQADALALPFADASFDLLWCLGVLCTTPDHRATLRELRRVLRPGGSCGLVVYVAQGRLPEQPEGNTFPSPSSLAADVSGAGFAVLSESGIVAPDAAPADWKQRTSEVEALLEQRHAGDPVWDCAQEQSSIIGRLLAADDLRGRVLILQAR